MTSSTQPRARRTNSPHRIYSDHAPHTYWELWRAGTGERAIVRFERNERYEMVCHEVAYVRTRKQQTENQPGHGWGYHTTVTWDLYGYRWCDLIRSGYPSDHAAFEAFVQMHDQPRPESQP
jgi:hypothetical protein